MKNENTLAFIGAILIAIPVCGLVILAIFY